MFFYNKKSEKSQNSGRSAFLRDLKTLLEDSKKFDENLPKNRE